MPYCLSIKVEIKKLKIILCATKSPRQTLLNMIFVIELIKLLILSVILCELFAEIIAFLKSYFMYYNEYWYIESIMERSFITKNKIEPLTLIYLYWFLVSSIFFSKIVDSIILLLISSLVFLLYSRVEIKLTSSNKVSYLLSFSNCNINFSHSIIFFL